MNTWAVQFSLSPGSAEPVYRQLVAQVQRKVAAGALAVGEEMPSVRELARALAVNPMTVSKAYGLLEAQGVLERRRGLAMVVAARLQPAAPSLERERLLRPVLEQAAAQAHELGLPMGRALALFKQVWQSQGPHRPIQKEVQHAENR